MTWFVIDGMDGCGKSSVGDYVKSELERRGRKVFFISHPSDGFWGRMERITLMKEGKIGRTATAVLYVLDVVSSLIKYRIKERRFDDAVFIRYSLGVCYLPEKAVVKGYDIIMKIFPTPDVKILVDVDEKTAIARILERGNQLESFEKTDELAHIRNKIRMVADDGWETVDNTRSVEETKKQIDAILAESIRCVTVLFRYDLFPYQMGIRAPDSDRARK